MAFDLGSIFGKLRIDFSDFLQGIGKSIKANVDFTNSMNAVGTAGKAAWAAITTAAGLFVHALIAIPGLLRITTTAMNALGVGGITAFLRWIPIIGLVIIGLQALIGVVKAVFSTMQRGIELVSNDLFVMRDRATRAWEATLRVGAIPYFEGMRDLLQAITRDLKEHGLIWMATTVTLTLASQALKIVLMTISGILNVALDVKNTFMSVTDSVREWAVSLRDALANATGIRFTLGQMPWPTTPSTMEVQGGAGRPRREILRELEQQRDAVQSITTIGQEQLSNEQQRLQVLVETARARGDEVGAAGLQRQMELGVLALTRENLINRAEAVKRQKELLEELGKEETAEGLARQQELRGLAAEQESLGLQIERVALAEREANIRGNLAVSLQRIAEIDKQIGMIEQEGVARGSLQAAQLRERRASEQEVIGTLATTQGRIFLDQEQQLRLELKIAMSQFGRQSSAVRLIESQLRINRLVADELDSRTQTELKTAAALHATEMENLALQQKLNLLQRMREEAQIESERKTLGIRGKALTPEREEMELGRIRLETDAILLENLRQQTLARQESLSAQLQSKVAAAETQEIADQTVLAFVNQMNALQDTLDLIVQRKAALADESRFLKELPERELGRRLASNFEEFLSSVLSLIAGEGAKFGEMLKKLGKDIIQSSLKPLLEEISRSFSEALKQLGPLASGLVGVALVAIGGLFDKQKAEVESLGENIQENIQSIERTRGLIAGETNIAIESISKDLTMALRPTNDILFRIEQAILKQAGLPMSTAVAQGARGYSITTEMIAASR